MADRSRATRRQFLKASATGAAAAALVGCLDARGREARGGGGPARPNILWISCEDMCPDMGCYGDAYARTPHLDRLAAQGARFDRAFAVTPVCAPCRSAIITAMYPSTIGSHHMRSSAVPPPYVKCFTEYLRAAGYWCTNDAKTDYNFPAPLTAWDECRKGADWRGRAPDEPFFAVINLEETHESQCWPIDGQLDHDPARAVLPPYYPDTPTVRRNWARYYDQVTRMDAHVGRILRRLEDDGLADATVVFFWADHGRGLTRAKRWVYDSGLHVPLLVRWPGRIAPGSARDDLVSLLDLGPTVLSLAGLQVPAHMQGRPFLGPAAGPPRDYVFATRDRMEEVYDMMRAVRDKRYKYIRNFQPEKPYAQPIAYMDKMPMLQEMRRLHAEGRLQGPPALWFRPTKPPEELYDTLADPHEIRNLADAPDHQDVLKRMRGVLDAWMEETGDLGLVPEPELKERMRPGDVWAVTADPVIDVKAGPSGGPSTVALSCPTDGASLAWTADPGKTPRWRLYSRPVELAAGAVLRAKACRIGYKDSAEVRASIEDRAGGA